MDFSFDKPVTQDEINKEINTNKIKLTLIIIGYIISLFVFPLFLMRIKEFYSLTRVIPFDYYNVIVGLLACCGTIVLIYFTPIIICQKGNLKDIEPDSCEFALSLCKKYPEIELYRQKVITLGRKLTNGEYQMMKAWAENAPAVHAFEILHSSDLLINDAL